MSDPRLEKFPQDILALIGNNVICCDLERRNWNNVCKAFYHAYLKLILPNRPRNCLTAICYYTRICHTPPFFFLPCKPRNKFYRENFAELTKRVLREFLQSRCDNHTKGIFVAALRDRGVIFPAAGIMDLAWTCIPYSDLRYYGTIDKFVTEKTSKYSLLKRLLDCLFSSKNPPVENVETALKMFYCHCNYRIPWDDVLRYWHLSIKSGGVHLKSLFKFVRMDQLTCDQLADIMINTIRTKIREIRQKQPEYRIFSLSHDLDIKSLFELPFYKFKGGVDQGVIPKDGGYLYRKLIPVMENYNLLGISRNDALKYLQVGLTIPDFVKDVIEGGDLLHRRLLIIDFVKGGYLDITDTTLYKVNDGNGFSTIGEIATLEIFAELFPYLLDVYTFEKSSNYINAITYIYISLTRELYYIIQEKNNDLFEVSAKILNDAASGLIIPMTLTKYLSYHDKLTLFIRHQFYNVEICQKIFLNIKDHPSDWMNEPNLDIESWMIALLETQIKKLQGHYSPFKKSKIE